MSDEATSLSRPDDASDALLADRRGRLSHSLSQMMCPRLRLHPWPENLSHPFPTRGFRRLISWLLARDASRFSATTMWLVGDTSFGSVCSLMVLVNDTLPLSFTRKRPVGYTGLMIGDDDLTDALAAWDLADLGAGVSVRWYGRGMNSTTWLVATDTGAWVAKAVPAAATAQFKVGLVAAARLDAAGVLAGAPLPTRTGALSVARAGACLALLRFVEGRALDPTRPDERRAWGAPLGRAHRILRTGMPPGGAQGWHWVDAGASHLAVEPWVRPAVWAVIDELGDVQRRVSLTSGVLHADPAPEAFLVDPHGLGWGPGRVALIDWAGVTAGPLLYDVASARMYAGDEAAFSDVRDGYLAVAPLRAEEMAVLPTVVRFRWAVQADYFARRIQDHDLTGIDDASGNAEGLADARCHLVGH